MATELAALLTDAFPDWGEFPNSCWVRWAVREDQEDFADEISAVTRCGEHRSIIGRLYDAHHPHRPHQKQHDDRLIDVFTEAEALAWAADVAQLGCPRFVPREGAPDLEIEPEWWIEAKTIHLSDAENAAIDEGLKRGGGMFMRPARDLKPPDSGLMNKFEYALSDALRKWERQDSGRLIVFFNLAGIDFPTSRRRALSDLGSWAQMAERRTGARIVVCHNYAWQAPVYSSS